MQAFTTKTLLKRDSDTSVFPRILQKIFITPILKEEHLRTSASVRYHFAIYCTCSALIHFTITCIYTDDDVYLYRRWRIFIQMMTCIYTDDNVSLYRRWATLWIVLLAIVLWEGIRKTTMKWKLAISDRNNDYFYKLTQTMFLTGFRKASYVYLQYTLLGEIFRKIRYA